MSSSGENRPPLGGKARGEEGKDTSVEQAMQRMGLDPELLNTVPSDDEEDNDTDKESSWEDVYHGYAQERKSRGSLSPNLKSETKQQESKSFSPTKKREKQKINAQQQQQQQSYPDENDKVGENGSLSKINWDNLRVPVSVHGETFVIPCGKGTQNIKWLANVATSRYLQEQKRKGARRDMESSNQRLSLTEKYKNRKAGVSNERQENVKKGQQDIRSGSYKPKCVRHRLTSNFSCSMLGPSLRIREVINYLDQKFIQDTPPLSHTEALTLDIELDTEEALFPDNSRSQSLWGALAHNFSDEGQRRAEFLRDRYVQKLKKQATEYLIEQRKTTQMRVNRLCNLLTVEDVNDDFSVERAMKADWSMFRLELVAALKDEKTELKKLIIRNFPALVKVFERYGGARKLGLQAMQWSEFCHFLELAQISKKLQESLSSQIFFKPLENDSSGTTSTGEKCSNLLEFMQSLLLSAKYLNGHRKYPNGACWTADDCFNRFLEDCILPMKKSIVTGKVREIIETVHVKKVIQHYNQAIRVVFGYYTCETGNKKKKGLLDLDTFTTVFYHAGLVPSDGLFGQGMRNRSQSSYASTLKECFNTAHKDEGAEISFFGKHISSEHLVYGEFLEAVCRFGVLHWYKHHESNEKKIFRALRAIAMVATHLGFSRQQLQLNSLNFDSEELIDSSLEELQGPHAASSATKDSGVGGIFKMTEHATANSHEVSPRSKTEFEDAKKRSAEWIDRFRREEEGSGDTLIDLGLGTAENQERNSFTPVATLLKGTADEPAPHVSRRLQIATEQIDSNNTLQRREQTIFPTSEGVIITGGGVTSSCAALPADIISTDEESKQESEDRRVHGLTESSKKMPRKPHSRPNRITRRL